MKITISKNHLKNLIEVLESQQKKDNSVSDFIEIELTSETEMHNHSDKLRFSAQSVYAECNNHFLGTN